MTLGIFTRVLVGPSATGLPGPRHQRDGSSVGRTLPGTIWAQLHVQSANLTLMLVDRNGCVESTKHQDAVLAENVHDIEVNDEFRRHIPLTLRAEGGRSTVCSTVTRHRPQLVHVLADVLLSKVFCEQVCRVLFTRYFEEFKHLIPDMLLYPK